MNLISDYYKNQIQTKHREDASWGCGRPRPRIQKMINRYKPETILDYGCGKRKIEGADRYDPGIPECDKPPMGKYDLVFCLDVLEHVEPEYIENVLDDLVSHIGKRGLFRVATVPARQKLPDGRDAHILIKPTKWWINKFKDRMLDIAWVNEDTAGFWTLVRWEKYA